MMAPAKIRIPDTSVNPPSTCTACVMRFTIDRTVADRGEIDRRHIRQCPREARCKSPEVWPSGMRVVTT